MFNSRVSLYGHFVLSRCQKKVIADIVGLSGFFCTTIELWFPIMGRVFFKVFELARIVWFLGLPEDDVYLCKQIVCE